MNSSARPIRRIASNLLWTAQGVLRNPLLEVDADGCIVRTDTCDNPDRQPFTEFYGGLLIGGFPTDFRAAFARLVASPQTPLAEQLAAITSPDEGCLVVISGLDYTSLRLTPQAQIRRI